MVKIDVLTYLSGYVYEVYERFVGSLIDTGFTGNIYIVIKDTTNDKSNIQLLKNKYNNIFEIMDVYRQNTHINCHRFFVFHNFLTKNKLSCEYILLCDSRDVLFQKNIENYEYDKDIDLFGFYESMKFYEELNYNVPWIKMLEPLVNEPICEKLWNSYIICCGTTIGTCSAIQKYVSQMCNILMRHNIKHNLDQGIHNYMIHLNKLDNIKIKCLSNSDNLVHTVGCDLHNHKINEEKKIVNNNNEMSYIVHQYDRFSKENKIKLSGKYNFII